MGCNCGKARRAFTNLVKPPASSSAQSQRPPPMPRAEKIRLRGLRIAARNAAILASQAKKNSGN